MTETAEQMWNITRMSLVALASSPVRVWNVGVGLATGAERDINGPISVVGAGRVAEEIAMVNSVSIQGRVASWLSLLDSVNLFVALPNLVSLLPPNGGCITGAPCEALQRGLTRLCDKNDLGSVDTVKMSSVTYLVGGFLLIDGVVLILADIVSPIKLF